MLNKLKDWYPLILFVLFVIIIAVHQYAFT